MKYKKRLWEFPWNYRESIIISFTLFIVGIALEWAGNGKGIANLFVYPLNIFFGIALIISILIISFLSKKNIIKNWLESIPAAICSISLLLLVSLLMGLILQNDKSVIDLLWKSGLSHIMNSWSYLFANLFLLLSLGVTTIKNIKSFSLKKLGFIISHLGLWIVLFGANFGSSQIQRVQMKIHEGEISDLVINKSLNDTIKLPFAIKLNDFVLQQYNPKLAIVDNKTGKILHGDGKNIILVDSGVVVSILGWKIEINEFLKLSAKAGNKYYFNNEPGAAPSVLVSANKDNNKVEGWVSCGSFNRQYESLKLNDEYSLIMMFPEPKEFTSEIEVLHKNKNAISYSLTVNKPLSIENWKIYQLSYDSELGVWSDISIIELIHDPWLPIVYSGIFMMLAGAIYMFWVGYGNKQEKN